MLDKIKEDTIVVLHPLDDIPEHLFQVWTVEDDCITGYSITGPLEGVYGEPGHELIKAIHKL